MSIVTNKTINATPGDSILLYFGLENDYKDAKWDIGYELPNRVNGFSSSAEDNFAFSFTVSQNMDSGWIKYVAHGEKDTSDAEYQYEQKDSIYINVNK